MNDDQGARTRYLGGTRPPARLIGIVLSVGLIVVVLAVVLPQLERLSGSVPAARVAITVARPVAVVPTMVARPEEAAISPLRTGAGVLHIKAAESWRTAKGEEKERYEYEFWYDRANGDARLDIDKVVGEMLGPEPYILLQEGRTYSMYFPHLGDVTTQTVTAVEPTLHLPTAVEEMFRFKTLLAEGEEFKLVGETTVDGKAALALGDLEVPESSARVYLDKATGLTLKIAPASFRTADDVVQNGTKVTDYPVIERVRRASLPAGHFSIDVVAAVRSPVPEYHPTATVPEPRRTPQPEVFPTSATPGQDSSRLPETILEPTPRE